MSATSIFSLSCAFSFNLSLNAHNGITRFLAVFQFALAAVLAAAPPCAGGHADRPPALVVLLPTLALAELAAAAADVAARSAADQSLYRAIVMTSWSFDSSAHM